MIKKKQSIRLIFTTSLVLFVLVFSSPILNFSDFNSESTTSSTILSSLSDDFKEIHSAYQNVNVIIADDAQQDVTFTYSLVIEKPDSGTPYDYAVMITKVTSSAKSITIPDSIMVEDGTLKGNTYPVKILATSSSLSGSGDTNILVMSKECTSIKLPHSLTHIGDKVFIGNTSLKSVSFNDLCNLKYLGKYAFNGCSGLESIKLPDSLTTISQSAFNGCSGLTSIDLPDSLTTIGRSAFQGCSGLESIKLPDSLTTIIARAFKDCSSLSSIVFDKNPSLTAIGDQAFCKSSDNTSGDNLTRIELPTSVQSIGVDSFSGTKFSVVINSPEIFITGTSKKTVVPEGKYIFNGHIISCNKDFDGINDKIVGKLISDDNYASIYVPSETSTDLSKYSAVCIPWEHNSSAKTFKFNFDALSNMYDYCEENTSTANDYFIFQENTLFGKSNNVITTVLMSNSSSLTLPSTVKYLATTAFRTQDSLTLNIQSEITISKFNRETFSYPSHIDAAIDYNVFKSGSKVVVCDKSGSSSINNDVVEGYSINLEYFIPYDSTNTTSMAISGYFCNVDNNTHLFRESNSCPVGSNTLYFATDLGTISVTNTTLIDSTITFELAIVNDEGQTYPINNYEVSVLGSTSNPINPNNGTYQFNTNAINSNVMFLIISAKSGNAHTVNYYLDSTSEDVYHTTSAVNGTILFGNQIPSDPTANLKVFGGWYTLDDTETKFNFESVISSDLNLYAHWSFRHTPTITFSSDFADIECIGDSSVSISSGTEVNPGEYTFKYSDLDRNYEFLYWEVSRSQSDSTTYSDKTLEIEIIEDVTISLIVRYFSGADLDSTIHIETPTPTSEPGINWVISTEIDNTAGHEWAGQFSTPVIVGNYIYVNNDGFLRKLDAQSGKELANVESINMPAYYHSIGYGNGIIIDYRTQTAYSLDLSPLFKIPDNISYLSYNDGYFYGIQMTTMVESIDNEERHTMQYSLVKIDGSYPDSAYSPTNIRDNLWSKSGQLAVDDIEINWFGQHGKQSSPVFLNEHMYIICTNVHYSEYDFEGYDNNNIIWKYAPNGHTTSTYMRQPVMDESRDTAIYLTSISLETGTIASSSKIADGNKTLPAYLDDGWLTHYEGRIYTTYYHAGLLATGNPPSQGAKIVSFNIDDSGVISDRIVTSLKNNYNCVSSAFLIHEGRGYLNVTDRSSGSSNSYLLVYDVMNNGTLTYAYEANSEESHGSLVLTTAYTSDDGQVYLYLIPYKGANILCFSDKPGQTEGKVTKFGGFDDLSNYNSEAVRSTEDGRFIWYNDGGILINFGMPYPEREYTFLVVSETSAEFITAKGLNPEQALTSIEGITTSGGYITSINGVDENWNLYYYFNHFYMPPGENKGGYWNSGLESTTLSNSVTMRYNYHVISSKDVSLFNTAWVNKSSVDQNTYGLLEIIEDADKLQMQKFIKKYNVTAVPEANGNLTSLSIEITTPTTLQNSDIMIHIKYEDDIFKSHSFKMSYLDGVIEYSEQISGFSNPLEYTISVYGSNAESESKLECVVTGNFDK